MKNSNSTTNYLVIIVILVSIIMSLVLCNKVQAQVTSDQYALATQSNDLYLTGADVKKKLHKSSYSISLKLTGGLDYVMKFKTSTNTIIELNGTQLSGQFPEMTITPSEDMQIHLTAYSTDKRTNEFSYVLLLKAKE